MHAEDAANTGTHTLIRVHVQPTMIHEDPNVITIRSSNCTLSNFHMCTIKFWNETFCSSEQAYQWRFMKYIGMDELADEILAALAGAVDNVADSRSL